MYRIADILMAIGSTTALISMCCLDSEGVTGYYAGAVGIIGALVVGSGYCIKRFAIRQRKCDFYYFRQTDKLEADVEWIEEGEYDAEIL